MFCRYTYFPSFFLQPPCSLPFLLSPSLFPSFSSTFCTYFVLHTADMSFPSLINQGSTLPNRTSWAENNSVRTLFRPLFFLSVLITIILWHCGYLFVTIAILFVINLFLLSWMKKLGLWSRPSVRVWEVFISILHPFTRFSQQWLECYATGAHQDAYFSNMAGMCNWVRATAATFGIDFIEVLLYVECNITTWAGIAQSV